MIVKSLNLLDSAPPGHGHTSQARGLSSWSQKPFDKRVSSVYKVICYLPLF